ncbi:DUF6998 domain-containing protein [Bacillus paranthracis]|uniref:DUF6998 domain-containing protein n=1 Tax=Bacillus paranthracis TaxID=2026186 RepID=UPI0028464DB0|nr:hypothetical protein [Bacillus paranthracis]MDR4144905.1 hypothetical protein [Bacillus paranthracis]MDR4393627.1 hypothetical protein [Bacillus paranthracis]
MLIEVDYDNMTIAEGLEHYSCLMRMFKKKGVIRTNMLVGDIGEYIAIEHYNATPSLPNLRLVEIGAKDIDAISDTNERYSIKASNGSATGVFKGLNPPNSNLPEEKKFDYVIVVLFNDMKPRAMYEFDWQSFLEVKLWNNTHKAWYINISEKSKRKSKIIYER